MVSFYSCIGWQSGKKCANLSLKFGVLIVGEIERRFFLQNAVCQQLFAWQKKVWWNIDPRRGVLHVLNPCFNWIVRLKKFSVSHFTNWCKRWNICSSINDVTNTQKTLTKHWPPYAQNVVISIATILQIATAEKMLAEKSAIFAKTLVQLFGYADIVECWILGQVAVL
jgi:hypothetical protein